MTVWRVLFVLAAIALAAGGPMHPRGGTMAEMLADPIWVPGHAIVLGGFLALLGGLLLFRRNRALPHGTDRWSRLAVFGTIGMAVEMAVHTAAAVDAGNLAAGLSTPVFTTHMWMARTLYPVFGVLMAGFIFVAARERTIGSPWVAPIGVIGALAWGVAPPMATTLGAQWAFLFPIGLMSLALWTLLAGLWPIRAQAPAPAAA